MLKFAQKYPEPNEYFPSLKEVMKWPRQYTINCIGVILGQRFTDWVDSRIEERNNRMAEERNTMILMDPEVAAAFAGSTYQSSKYYGSISDNLSLSNLKARRAWDFHC